MTMAFVLLATTAYAATALTPEEIRDAYYRSYNYERVQDYDNAVKALSTVLEKYPDAYTVNLRLGWLFYLRRNYANSTVHYAKAIKAAPYSVEARLGSTLPLMAQAKYPDVEAICNTIMTTDYYNYQANLKLAFVLRMQEKRDLAEKVINKMLALYPTDIYLLSELAILKAAGGDKTAAARIFGDVLVLDPENVTAKGYFSGPTNTSH
jgi:tetratricopeptide (TPR) repeat protein